MPKDYSKVLSEVAKYHKDVERAYKSAQSSNSFKTYFGTTNTSMPKTILNALFTSGGGLTEAALRKLCDNCPRIEHDQDFSQALSMLKSGFRGSAHAVQMLERKSYNYRLEMQDCSKFMDLMVQEFGNADLYSLCQGLSHDPAVFEQGGLLYLWCQKKNGEFCRDIGGPYGDINAAIKKCEAAVKAGEDAPAAAKELESLIKEKAEERNSLGLFKGKRGKELKGQIAEAEAKLAKEKSLVKKAQDAKTELTSIYSALDKF